MNYMSVHIKFIDSKDSRLLLLWQCNFIPSACDQKSCSNIFSISQNKWEIMHISFRKQYVYEVKNATIDLGPIIINVTVVLDTLWKESLSSDGQQLHQYHQNKRKFKQWWSTIPSISSKQKKV
jgi:hypothetical protein